MRSFGGNTQVLSEKPIQKKPMLCIRCGLDFDGFDSFFCDECLEGLKKVKKKDKKDFTY